MNIRIVHVSITATKKLKLHSYSIDLECKVKIECAVLQIPALGLWFCRCFMQGSDLCLAFM